MHVEHQRRCSATIAFVFASFSSREPMQESDSFSLEYFFHLARCEVGLSKTEPCLAFQTVIVVLDKPAKEIRSTQMAKKNNVHPDYYKTAGREPVGQSTVHEDHKREFASAAKTEASDGAWRGKGRKHRRPSLTNRVKRRTNQPAGSTGS